MWDFKTILSLLLGFFFVTEGVAQAFEVEHAKVDIYINADGYFDVVENYLINFKSPKHGIIRTIQTNYDLLTFEGKKEKRKIKIRNVEVLGHKFSADFNFTQNRSDNFDIKIGSKRVMVLGEQHYQIKYRVYNAFLFEKDVIRFYWNIKPDNWEGSFKRLDFTVHPPENIKVSVKDFFVYSGSTGTTDESGEFNIRFENGFFTSESYNTFFSGRGSSVTVLLNLPPGSIIAPNPFWAFWYRFGWVLILSILVLVFYLIWYFYGKDEEVVMAIAYFPPQDIDSAMAGFLIDDLADTRHLVSLIPYWASRGLIKMEELPNGGYFGKDDIKLIRLKPLPEDSADYEQEIFKSLFGPSGEKSEIIMSKLKKTFYVFMSTARTYLTRKAQMYYDPKANKVRSLAAGRIGLTGVGLFVWFILYWGVLAAIMVIPVVIFLLIITPHLKKKNAKGSELLSELRGFQEFIKVAEVNKLKMLLDEYPTYFETTMAYALAFGMFDEWAKKFEVLNLQPPTWYTSSAGAFTMHQFSKSFSGAIASAQATMVRSPSVRSSSSSSSSSRGGGSSGGGFGGGGGRSW